MVGEEVSAVDAFAAIVVVLIVVAGIMSILLYAHMTTPAHESPEFPTVEEGDEVEFIYTGYLENTLVFETLDEAVAIDNETYPKSLLFEWPEGGHFEPVSLTVGQGISHVNFDHMADEGRILEEAMMNLKVNETNSIDVAPERGFGEPDPSKRVTRNLVEKRDKWETISVAEFGDRFQTSATVNATIIDPRWGWDVRITEMREGPVDPEVTINNLPYEGMIVSPYVGFQSEVISVDDEANEGKGEIVVRHLLVPDDVNEVMGDSPTGEGKFIVIGVNEAAGTYEADFNSQKAGEILRYEIKIVSIVKH